MVIPPQPHKQTLHIHEHKLPAKGRNLHPLSGVPDALEALRLKASKKRMNKRYSMQLHLIVKLQAQRRGQIARTTTKQLKTSAAYG